MVSIIKCITILLVTLRAGNSSEMLFDANAATPITSETDIYLRSGCYNAEGIASPTTTKVLDTAENTSAITVQLSFVVTAYRVDIFIDGQWVGCQKAPSGTDYGVKQNSEIVLWAQSSEATIDNLTVYSID